MAKTYAVTTGRSTARAGKRAVCSVHRVPHGASGIPDRQIREAVRLGVCKITIDTGMRDAFARSVRRTMEDCPELIDPRKILGPAIDAVQEVVAQKVSLFGSAGKA